MNGRCPRYHVIRNSYHVITLKMMMVHFALLRALSSITLMFCLLQCLCVEAYVKLSLPFVKNFPLPSILFEFFPMDWSPFLEVRIGSRTQCLVIIVSYPRISSRSHTIAYLLAYTLIWPQYPVEFDPFLYYHNYYVPLLFFSFGKIVSSRFSCFALI